MEHQVSIAKCFQKFFDEQPDLVCHAPGRVNLIGDHTDYNDGLVLPIAINYGTNVAVRERADNKIKVVALDIGEQQVEFNLDDIQFDSKHSWSNYIRGVLKILTERFPQLMGLEMIISGNVPQGAGLSSSASLEIAVLKAITELYNLPLDGVQAALIGQQAENDFVGCNCGIMDQLISAMGSKNHAMQLDCRDLSFIDAPLSDDIALFIVNSNVKRGLVGSEYNLRREQCEQVAKFFDRPALRDVQLNELIEAESKLAPLLFQRARHVITENQRVQRAAEALKCNDLSALGNLMQQSHQSLKNDFEVTTPELDALAEMLNQALGSKGGARMTGGGFGGCVVAIAPKTEIENLSAIVNQNYPKQFGYHADIYICTAEQGAFR